MRGIRTEVVFSEGQTLYGRFHRTVSYSLGILRTIKSAEGVRHVHDTIQNNQFFVFLKAERPRR